MHLSGLEDQPMCVFFASDFYENRAYQQTLLLNFSDTTFSDTASLVQRHQYCQLELQAKGLIAGAKELKPRILK